MSYSPLHGSTPHNVCLYFKTNEDEELSAKDIELKYGVPARDVHKILLPALEHGLLHRPRPGIYSAGAALAGWQASTEPPAPRPLRAKRAAPLDLASVQIHDRPIPPRGNPVGIASVNARLWAQLKPGQGVDLKTSHMRALKSWCTRHKVKVEIRRLDDDLYGCWKPAE